MRILLVDDERIKRTVLSDDLVDAGYETAVASCADEGLNLLETQVFDVVVTDLRMGGIDGLSFLRIIKDRWPDTDVIMMTAFATVDNAVEAMKLGAFDYITKPFETAKLVLLLEKIAELRNLKSENAHLKAKLAGATRNGEIVGQSQAMRDACAALELAVDADVPVLLYGETGTGKELFATAIQQRGSRRDQPFIRVSCAALSRQLMESELFGHEAGAFTGALTSKPGRFELADKGTLFLDEIDDVPPEIQVKLLRVLEGRPFERVGGIESITSNVRLIAASKVDLQEMVEAGTFRRDLYYRLSVFPLTIPPLRERREDIPLLVEHFLNLYTNGNSPDVEEDVMAMLWDRDWPGNVRELQNVVRRTLLGLGGSTVITREDVPVDMRMASRGGGESMAPKEKGTRSFKELIEEREKALLAKALDESGGNQSKAAAQLDMKLSTFRDKLAKYDIHADGGNARNATG